MLSFIEWNLHVLNFSPILKFRNVPLFVSATLPDIPLKHRMTFLSSHYNRTLAEWPNVSSLFDPSRCLPCDALNLRYDMLWTLKLSLLFMVLKSGKHQLRLVVYHSLSHYIFKNRVVLYVQKMVGIGISEPSTTYHTSKNSVNRKDFTHLTFRSTHSEIPIGTTYIHIIVCIY